VKQRYEEFFAARLPFPGLAACAVRLPDGTILHQSFSRWLTTGQIEQVTGQLAQTSETLQGLQIAPMQMAWIFEHLRVYLRLRPDKACLALFVENRPELESSSLNSALEEFGGWAVS
jgi:hypothetical protein